MAEMNIPKKPCIKCGKPYTEPDEAYLCTSCLEEKKKIAAVIDARFPHKPDTQKSIDERFAPYDLRNILGRR